MICSRLDPHFPCEICGADGEFEVDPNMRLPTDFPNLCPNEHMNRIYVGVDQRFSVVAEDEGVSPLANSRPTPQRLVDIAEEARKCLGRKLAIGAASDTRLLIEAFLYRILSNEGEPVTRAGSRYRTNITFMFDRLEPLCRRATVPDYLVDLCRFWERLQQEYDRLSFYVHEQGIVQGPQDQVTLTALEFVEERIVSYFDARGDEHS